MFAKTYMTKPTTMKLSKDLRERFTVVLLCLMLGHLLAGCSLHRRGRLLTRTN
jgi:hypothetical protein